MGLGDPLRHRWQPKTLSGLLNLYLGLGLTLFTLLAGVFLHVIVSHTLEDTLRDKAQALSQQLAVMTLDSVLMRDYVVIERFAEDLVRQSNDILFLHIQTIDGETLAKVGDDQRASTIAHFHQTTPILFMQRSIGEIQLVYSRDLVEQTFKQIMLFALGGLLVLLGLQSWLIRRLLAAKLIHPIEQLLANLNPLKQALNQAEAFPDQPVEVLGLQTIFNQLKQDINKHIKALEQAHSLSNKMVEKLNDGQRLAAIGQMAAGLAHNLNTPLATIIGYSQMVYSTSDDDAIKKRMQIIERQAKTSAEVVKSLLNASRAPNANLSELQASDYLDSFCKLLKPILKQKGLQTIKLDLESIKISADGGLLEQVLFNLFGNAVEAGATEIHVKLNAQNNQAWLSIIDNGAGIPPDLQSEVFKAFVTTKPSHQGTGLGLFMANQMLNSMHAHLELITSKPGYTEFRLYLNLAQAHTKDKVL
ncbi:HAMP domain-containing histidine kinase [Thiomicrospira microaerophila]|nr:HAMP domain-containing histidine kinase [Thiomicrospira microaerophila]